VNANGSTEPGELISLHRAGLTQLATIPNVNNRQDPAGNDLSMWAWARNTASIGNNQYKMFDVFFKAL